MKQNNLRNYSLRVFWGHSILILVAYTTASKQVFGRSYGTVQICWDTEPQEH